MRGQLCRNWFDRPGGSRGLQGAGIIKGLGIFRMVPGASPASTDLLSTDYLPYVPMYPRVLNVRWVVVHYAPAKYPRVT